MSTPRGRLASVFALAVGVTAVACGRGGGAPVGDPLMDVFHRRAQEEGLSRIQTEGKRLFVRYCVTCHGASGEGDGQNAYNLEPKPPNFRDSLKTHPPPYWRQVIEGGTAAVGRSPLCPPRGHNLSPGQIDALSAYLEALSGVAAPSRPRPAASGTR